MLEPELFRENELKRRRRQEDQEKVRGDPRRGVKSVGSTPVQCVDHLVPLCSGTFSFSVLGVGAE